ncbi:hypothetical protein [Photobacterium leiognathi]|uniref:hypothetical protein n=1 Tax=Photobacterium leiognathi TaxID=553611 RepID=UPI0029822443|nr:hypothetical protein [Photobacterium leiognathi]
MMFPGEYYLTSRYNSNIATFLIYLAKYWGTIIIFYEIFLGDLISNTASFYCINLLLYFSIYDYFCCINDNEPGAVTQREGKIVSLSCTLFYVTLFSCLGLFFYGLNFSYTMGVCLLITIIFYIHNELSEKFRVITYFLLYFLKPFLFFHDINVFLSIVIFSSLYAFSYIPFYFIKKFALQWPNIFLKTIFSGIFLKIFFLLCFIPFYPKLTYLLICQILFTILDFVSNKRFSSHVKM